MDNQLSAFVKSNYKYGDRLILNLEIEITGEDGKWLVMGTDSLGESAGFGIEHDLDEAVNEQFLPSLSVYILKGVEKYYAQQ